MINFGQFLLTDALVIFPVLIFLILILFGMGVLLLMLSGSISNKFLKINASNLKVLKVSLHFYKNSEILKLFKPTVHEYQSQNEDSELPYRSKSPYFILSHFIFILFCVLTTIKSFKIA